jgi:hypothetical protein
LPAKRSSSSITRRPGSRKSGNGGNPVDEQLFGPVAEIGASFPGDDPDPEKI